MELREDDLRCFFGEQSLYFPVKAEVLGRLRMKTILHKKPLCTVSPQGTASAAEADAGAWPVVRGCPVQLAALLPLRDSQRWT